MSEEPVPKELVKWKFFHVRTRWGSLGDVLTKNLTLEQAIQGWVCPFVVGEVYPSEGGALVNPRALLSYTVYGTDKPVDNEWPPVKKGGLLNSEIADYLDEHGHSCSSAAYAFAVLLITSGAYSEARESVLSQFAQNFVFMISVIGEPEVDAVYTSAIKPVLLARGLTVARADEMRHATLITSAIFNGIAQSKFVVADLTNARPNCYYELGYAHALGKTVILVAQVGTPRHFDVAGYRWNYWTPRTDFRPHFDAEVRAVIEQLEQAKEVSRATALS